MEHRQSRFVYFLFALFLAGLFTAFGPWSSVPVVHADEPAVMFSGMDAEFGLDGWSRTDARIHLSDGSYIDVKGDGEHFVAIPDGFGGKATQIVRVDSTPPDVSAVWNDERQAFSVFVSDYGSLPAHAAISLDGGATWQERDFNSSASFTWDVIWDQPLADQYEMILEASDRAGNLTRHQATFKK